MSDLNRYDMVDCDYNGPFMEESDDGEYVEYKAYTEQASELKWVKEALEPSGSTKFAYMGEFSFSREVIDENGDDVTETLKVPWTTIKEIMAAISERAAQSKRARS